MKVQSDKMKLDLDVGHKKYCEQMKLVETKTGIPEDKI